MWRTVALIALGVASAEDQHDLSRPSWNLLLEASWNRLEVEAHRTVARAAAVPRALVIQIIKDVGRANPHSQKV